MDAEELRAIVAYDNGLLRWVNNHKYFKKIKAGDVVGLGSLKNGYRCTAINGRQYYQHRLVWLHVHGSWPDGPLDHINGDRKDNRIENLRAATPSQNQHNRKKTKNKPRSTGAYKHWSGRWYSTIMVESKKHYLGMFGTEDEAAKAYAEAKVKLHPFNPTVRNLE